MRSRRRPLLRALLAVVATSLVAALPVVTPRPPGAVAATPAPGDGGGYWLVGGDGSVYPFGVAGDLGSLRGTRPSHPVAGMTPTPSGAGYWLVASDGGVFSFGDAAFYGSTGAIRLNQPIVGMAATPTGRGYWFVAADGGIFSFGDAAFYGSTGALTLNQPIVGMAATPTGKGYWFVAADGGIFNYGDAAFYGSTGALTLNQPIVGMAATPTGKGYWFVAADGGIFNYGDAAFYGSTGGTPLSRPITGMAATNTGGGYWFVASDGGIFNFGDAPFIGSAGGKPLPAGVVGLSGAGRAGAGPAATTATTTATSGPESPSTSPTTTGTTPTSTVTTTTGPAPSDRAFQIGLVGDSGYKPDQFAIFDRVVAQMNTFPLAFVAHDGDFKDPNAACTDARVQSVKTAFDKSKAPFVYTPGDNEWMDCDKVVNNPADPLERLANLRETFFPEDETLGINRMPVTTQRQDGYPENFRWSKEGVVFATLNAPGPNDDVPNTDESNARRTANAAWLTAAFDQAEATDAPAVMIIWQADAWQPLWRKTWAYLLDILKARTLAFGKPVVLVHGDTHLYRIDKGGWRTPTGDTKGAWDDVPNFTRVETYAAGLTASGAGVPAQPNLWIRVTVDPAKPKVFSFTTEDAG